MTEVVYEVSPRRHETREKLLDAALAVFAEHGLQGASVEEVCGAAGFSRGAFYSNFSSKEELFVALLEREYQARVVEVTERASALGETIRSGGGSLSPEAAARFITEFFVPIGTDAKFMLLESEFWLLAMRDPSGVPEIEQVLELQDRFHNALVAVVDDVVSSAGRRFVVPVARALPIVGGIFERAFRVSHLAGPDAPEGIKTIGDRVSELLFAITEPA